MTKPANQSTSMFKGYKAVIAIAAGIAISLAILTFSDWVTTPNKKNPYFSYGPQDKPNSLIHVIDDQRVQVPIVFEIGPGVPEISLAFSGEHDGLPGFSITENTVEVVNGRATSIVVIQFTSKPNLKAGTHLLKIVARDKSTGKVVRSGEIQFTYNIHEVTAKCSC